MSIRSPWGESPSAYNRNDNDDRSNNVYDRGGSISHGLLGSLIERSTSAPPLSSSDGLSFGDGGSLFGRDRGDREQSTMGPLYENRNREETFLARPQAGRASASSPSYSKPDFSSLLQQHDGLSSSDMDNKSFVVETSFSRAGAELIRSQSAAPTFHGRSPLFPPPGLAEIKESQPTPSTVDSYSSSHSNGTTTNHNSGISHGHFESAVDRGADIMTLGQRRSASTGVIGSTGFYASPGTGGGALRPTFMDLIQEDDVPENPHRNSLGSQQQQLNQQQQQDPFDSYNRHHQASPQMQLRNGGLGGDQQYMYTQHQQQQQQHMQHQQMQHQYMAPRGDLHDRMQQQHQQPGMRTVRDAYDMGASLNDPMRTGQPQYITLTDHGMPGEPTRGQGTTMYAGVPHGGHPVHRSPPPQPDAQRQIYYSGQPHQQMDLQTPVITQGGQTVYLNAPAAPYGYATVQYHPHHQQAQIIRQSVPGRGHPHEQFVSVVPIQGGAAQLASIAGSGQAYAYWQPDGGGGPIAVPQVTIMNATGPGGAPITVARIGNPQMDSPHANNAYGGGRGKEKGGKGGRRGGGTPSSRRGGEVKHSPHSSSSPLLEEFRATKSRDWTIRDIEGHVVEFCQDQNGSRFIQQRLEVGDASEQRVVMNEVLPAINRLRNDVFGNYVVQKLLEFGTPQMKSGIRDTLQGEMLQLSLQMYGCRVVQKALETLDEDDLPRLLREFHHNVLSCIHDQNGNHVIQKCIEVMSNKAKRAREIGDDAKADFLGEQMDFVVDDVLGNTASLSCHPYGCRVLQRILEHCIESKKTAALDEISKCHKTLLDDQYGNYVIQHVLQFGRQSDRESILHIVVENGLLILSKQKFASNVVEKLLKYGTAQQRKAVVREMLKVVDDQTGAVKPAGSTGSSVVLLMVRDAYANYVVQTTLDVVPECEERRLLLEELNAHAAELRNYTFAKHIMTKLSS